MLPVWAVFFQVVMYMATQMQVCFTGLVLRIFMEQGMEVFFGDLSLGER